MLDTTVETAAVEMVTTETRTFDAEGPGVFKIPACRFAELEAKLARLARRAAKIGVPVPTMKKVGEDKRPIYRHDPEGIYPSRVVGYLELVVVEVSGEAPKFAGWTFLARLERLTSEDKSASANIIHKLVESAELPEEYRTSAPKCDHCKTKRRRNDTFVVQHEDGRVLQVGSSCLADFLGHPSPETLAAQCTYLLEFFGDVRDAEEWGLGGFREPDAYDLASYLTWVSVAIRNAGGWLSRSAAYEQGRTQESTATVAWNIMTSKEAQEKVGAPLPLDVERGRLATEWGQTVDPKNDYFHNLKTIATLGVVSLRSAGLAASLLPAYDRELAREAERKRRAERPILNEYMGTVGERLGVSKKGNLREGRLVLECVACRDFKSEWGAKYLIVFEDAEGRSYKWWSTKGRLDVDTTYLLAGTVKKHEEYKGRKQTVLTRCDAETEEGLLEREARIEKAREEALAKKAAWKALKKDKLEEGEWIEVKASELRSGMFLAESVRQACEERREDFGPISAVYLLDEKVRVVSETWCFQTEEKTWKSGSKVLVRVVGCAEVSS
jgi:hypothetical protein